MNDRKEYFRKYWKERRKTHGDDLRRRSLDWHYKNKERASKTIKEWRKKNRSRINARHAQRCKTEPWYKMRYRINSRIHEMLQGFNGARKADKTERLLGCPRNVFLQWIESQFCEGMSWENHGVFGWHLDHIIPCSFFDLSDPEEQKKCFHYTNLQPLWWKENLSKSNKLLSAALICSTITTPR